MTKAGCQATAGFTRALTTTKASEIFSTRPNRPAAGPSEPARLAASREIYPTKGLALRRIAITEATGSSAVHLLNNFADASAAPRNVTSDAEEAL
jgi:hypothetical protein